MKHLLLILVSLCGVAVGATEQQNLLCDSLEKRDFQEFENNLNIACQRLQQGGTIDFADLDNAFGRFVACYRFNGAGATLSDEYHQVDSPVVIRILCRFIQCNVDPYQAFSSEEKLTRSLEGMFYEANCQQARQFFKQLKETPRSQAHVQSLDRPTLALIAQLGDYPALEKALQKRQGQSADCIDLDDLNAACGHFIKRFPRKNLGGEAAFLRVLDLFVNLGVVLSANECAQLFYDFNGVAPELLEGRDIATILRLPGRSQQESQAELWNKRTVVLYGVCAAMVTGAVLRWMNRDKQE